VTPASKIRALALPAIVGAATLLLVFAGIAVAGFDLGEAVRAAVRGTIGSPFAVFSATLTRTTPLLFLGIAVAIAFRAGVLNIGGEGQFLVGAAAGVATALALPPETPPPLLLPLELAAGVAAGAAWGVVPAWLVRRFGVSEVVSTLLLNFVALNLVGFLIRGPLQEPTGAYPQSSAIPESAWLPMLLPGQQLHLGFLLAVALAGATWWYFRRTASGFRLILTGASPSVAESAGRVDVASVRFRALVVSGAIAGLAGVSTAAGTTHILYEGLSPGYGYAAIGVALLGGLHPGGIVAAAIVFGMLGAGADAMQRDAQVPPELASVMAAVVILGMLAIPTLVHRGDREPRPTADPR
jgi:ABC-type uncharacterized transport system permease subunit